MENLRRAKHAGKNNLSQFLEAYCKKLLNTYLSFSHSGESFMHQQSFFRAFFFFYISLFLFHDPSANSRESLKHKHIIRVIWEYPYMERIQRMESEEEKILLPLSLLVMMNDYLLVVLMGRESRYADTYRY